MDRLFRKVRRLLEGAGSSPPRPLAWHCLLIFLPLVLLGSPGLLAQEEDSARPERSDTVEERLRRLEEANRRLQEQNEGLRKELESTNQKLEEVSRKATESPPLPPPIVPGPTLGSLAPPVFAPADIGPPPPVPTLPEPTPVSPPRFLIGDRDDGLGQYVLLRSPDATRHPYELRADFWTQFRYTNFSRATRHWVDSAGQVLPVRSISLFEINRNWILFNGYALDPRLQYYMALFSSTAINDTTLLGWVNYRFSDAFDLRAGYWLIPGSREWITSFRYTLGADRTMATTFFRPNISPGIWAQGEPIEGLNYIFMVANSFNRFNQTSNRVGNNMAFAGSLSWEPLGPFGPGPSDIEHHERLTPRFGTSFTVARELSQRQQENPTNPEDTILRLSDGTPVFQPNALGPGVQVSAVGIQLLALDAALKYRGFSLAGEYYLRWLDNFRFRSGSPDSLNTFSQGGYAQAGWFVVPRSLELYARHSVVTGHDGTGTEWGGGLNWYVQRSRDWRITLEVTKVNHSPADNILTGYRAGSSGTLFQLQMFTDF